MTTLRIVCKNLETEGSKGLGTTTYAQGVVITNTKGRSLNCWCGHTSIVMCTCIYMLQEFDWVLGLPSIGLNRNELPCNHGNYHLVNIHWPHNHVYFARHIYEGHTDQNAPLSGKYTVDYLHISHNCQYILSSISESHGSPKTNFTALKEKAPKNI